jgi:LuxR family transcriptional regulator, quorum-sensing system regulator SolR
LHFEDYVDRSARATTIGELARLYSEAIAPTGYADCVLTTLKGKRVEHVAWSDIPRADRDACIERRWRRIDRELACSLHVCRPFIWRDDDGLLDRDGQPSDREGECGIAFPFHAPGQRLDLMSIKRCGTAPADLAQARLLHAISFHAWTRYLDLLQERLFLEASGEALTSRELEILDWCKKGKTRPDIARILAISPKTVEFHLSNVMNKLGASNQLAAVVIALQRGLLELSADGTHAKHMGKRGNPPR